MSLEQYAKVEITNVEEDLTSSGNRFPSKCIKPLSSNYVSWLEDSPEPMAGGMQQYQEIIDQLRCAVEIGRMYILLETSLLSSYLAMNRVRHLNQAFHIFGYLKAYPERKLGFDPAHPAIN